MITLRPTEPGLQHRVIERRQCGHRDRAPPRRRHGHGGADHRAPGQRPHPRAGAGPAGHRPAQGADRQDGAADVPRGAPDDVGGGSQADARADRLQDLSLGEGEAGRSYVLRETPVVPGESSSTRSRASTSAPTSRSSPSASTSRARASSATSPRTTSARRSPSCSTTRCSRRPVDPRADPRRLGADQRAASRSRPPTTLRVQLRSGALPAKLTIVEERTVGPSLGADSIAAGKLARRSSAACRSWFYDHRLRHVRACSRCVGLIVNGSS